MNTNLRMLQRARRHWLNCSFRAPAKRIRSVIRVTGCATSAARPSDGGKFLAWAHMINGVMRALPKGMGRGTSIGEPTQYGQPPFTKNGTVLETNAKMTEYPKMAKSYNLPVPSGTCR